MLKQTLIGKLAAKSEITQTQAKAFYENLIQIAREAVAVNGEVDLPGLVKIKKVHRESRKVYNIATGQSSMTQPKDVLKARVSYPNKWG